MIIFKNIMHDPCRRLCYWGELKRERLISETLPIVHMKSVSAARPSWTPEVQAIGEN